MCVWSDLRYSHSMVKMLLCFLLGFLVIARQKLTFEAKSCWGLRNLCAGHDGSLRWQYVCPGKTVSVVQLGGRIWFVMYKLASGSCPGARLAGSHVFCGHLHIWLDKHLFSFFLIALCSVLGVRTRPWREREGGRGGEGVRREALMKHSGLFCEIPTNTTLLPAWWDGGSYSFLYNAAGANRLLHAHYTFPHTHKTSSWQVQLAHIGADTQKSTCKSL